jgi:serralysin
MSTVPLTGNQDIDGILWGVRWDLASLTYGFATATNQYFGYQAGSISGFQAFNTQQQNAVHAIMDNLQGFVGIGIAFTNDPTQANLRFAEASFVNQDGFGTPGTITTAVGTPPDDSTFPTFAHGDMFFNSTDYNSPRLGNFAYHTLIHELGHALGLKHGHVSQSYPGGTATIPKLPGEHDSMEFSVMTYRANVGGPTNFYHNETFGFAQSFMMLDIQALQYLYGADFTFRSSNTTYTWNKATGEMSVNGQGQGKPGANRVFLTIWDGGGEDTYDMSNYSTNVTIDLNPGSFSITAQNQLAVLNTNDDVKSRGNVFNALLFDDDLRSLIENAIGGSGNDKITGNVGQNTLEGNGGNDKLTGLDGADSLDGGAGSDTLKGGKGNDAYFYGGRNEGGDEIADFSSAASGNNDVFQFKNNAFGNLGKGAIDANQFQSSNAATAAKAAVRFLFEEDTGILRYDADGKGGAAAVIIATLLGNETMTIDDIRIV